MSEKRPYELKTFIDNIVESGMELQQEEEKGKMVVAKQKHQTISRSIEKMNVLTKLVEHHRAEENREDRKK